MNETQEIIYGNLEGRYFTQWRIDFLKDELLPLIIERFGEKISSIKIWYDEHNDYHRLDFHLGGTEIRLRFYKVIGIEWDGADPDNLPWPFPRSGIYRLVSYIENEITTID